MPSLILIRGGGEQATGAAIRLLHAVPLLIKADGARQKPLKAPAEHEPPIPDFVETVVVVAGLIERHSLDLSPIVAPQVQGQRANPVLFDRDTFPELMSLSGDVGGRAVFSKFPLTYLPWHDESLLVDVDKPEDLEKLA